MVQKEMVQQIIELYQATFDSTFNATALLQDQFEHVANTVLDQAQWLPAESRNAIDSWVDAYKTGRDNYKQFMDESYRKAHAYFEA